MARPLIAPLAPNLVLQPGYTVKLIAVNATTGAAVSGVVVSNVSMQVDMDDPPSEEKIALLPPFLAHTKT